MPIWKKYQVSLQVCSQIGYLGQNPHFYSWMTGLELLNFAGELFGLSRRENRSRALELLEMAGLKKAATRRLGSYSGGMIQRLGIAQALVSRPAVLFLDEPVSSLDPFGRKEVLAFIRQLKEQTTVFMSTHILEDVERICDQVGIINQGKILITEDMQVVKQQYAPPRVELGFDKAEDRERFLSLAAGETWIGDIITENQTLIIKHEDFSVIRQPLLNLVTTHQLSLNKLVTSSATLEDVFVQLVGGSHA